MINYLNKILLCFILMSGNIASAPDGWDEYFIASNIYICFLPPKHMSIRITGSTGQARGRTYVIVYPDNSKSDGNTGDLNKLELYISPQNIEVGTAFTITDKL